MTSRLPSDGEPAVDADLPLVHALQRGDEQALDELMARHKEAIYRFLIRCVGSEQEAEELAQETFVRVYFKIGQFRPSARFTTWLFQIALNLGRDYLRSKRHRQAMQTASLSASGEEAGRVGEIAAHEAGPREVLAMREELEVVQAAVASLPEKLREALLLTAVEEHSHHTAAAILKTTAKTIEMRVYRARKLLAEQLARWRRDAGR